MSWRRTFGTLFVSVAFLYLGITVYRNAADLRAQDWSVRPVLLGLSILLYVAGLVWGVGAWKVLLKAMGHDVPLLPLCRVWFLSALGRYIPGKIWQFVGAAQMGRATGLPVAVTVTALAAHMGFFSLGAGIVSIYLVPAALGMQPEAVSLLQWAAPLTLLLLHPALVGRALSLLRRITGRDLLTWSGSWGDAIGIVLLSVVGWALTGGALFLFVSSLTPLPASALLPVVGMNALSFIVGTLFFIAPAGLGAKEGALALMLASYMTVPAAAIVAVAARLWTIAAEVAPALLLLGSGGGRQPSDVPEAPLSHR